MNWLFGLILVSALLGYTSADRKRCFCKVVDDSNNVIHDFGSIEEHHNWLSVSCRRLHGCADKCDQRVKDWVCTNQDECRAKAGGKQVRPYYQASVCGQGTGSNIRPCGCTGGGFNNVPKCQFECLQKANVMDFISCFNTCFSG